MLEIVTRRDHGAGGWRGRVDVQQAEVRHDLTDGDRTGDATACSARASSVATTTKTAGTARAAQTARAGSSRATTACKAATAGVATEPASATPRLRRSRRPNASASTTRRHRTNDVSVTARQ